MEELQLLSVRKDLRAFTLWIAQDPSGRRFYCFRLRPALAADPDVRKVLARNLAPFQEASHPSIAHFHGTREPEGFWALYEYAEGELLSEVLASRGRLSLKEALEVAFQVSDGLAELHRLGLVNGSLSPDEILLLRGGGVKILGAGLSQALYRLGLPYRIWLDPLWIAPEMHAGRPLTPAADVYSIGLLLQRMRETPQPQAEGPSALLPKLKEIIGVCLSPEPHDRYRNAHLVKMLLLDELKALEKEAEVPAEVEEEAFDWVALLLGAIALLAVVGVVVLWTIVYYRYAGVF